MSKEILQEIRSTHDRNRAEAGLPVGPATGHLAGDGHTLDSLRRRVSAGLHDGVQQAVADFRSRLDRLAAAQAPTHPTRSHPTDDPLLKTQEITFEDLHRNAVDHGSPDTDQLARSLRAIEQRLESFSTDSNSDSGRALQEISAQLDQVNARLKAWDRRIDTATTSQPGHALESSATDIVPQIRLELETFHETLMETLQQSSSQRGEHDSWQEGMTQVVGSDSELHRELEATRSSLERVGQQLSDRSSNGGALDGNGVMALLEQILEKIDTPPETEFTEPSSGQGAYQQASLERLGEIEAMLIQIWERADAAAAPADTTATELSQLTDSIRSLEQRISTQLTAPGASSAEFEVTGSRAVAAESIDPSGAQEVTEALLQRLSQLETFLHKDWESALQRFSEVASQPTEADTETLKGLMEIRTLIERSASQPLAQEARANSTSSSDEPSTAVQSSLIDQMQSLRKDFSILVHTLNAHLEESQLLTHQVVDNVAKSLTILESKAPSTAPGAPNLAADSSESESSDPASSSPVESRSANSAGSGTADSEARPDETASALRALESALDDLQELRTLPEKLSAILSAADEVNQFSLSSAIQDAVDQITAQLREFWSAEGAPAPVAPQLSDGDLDKLTEHLQSWGSQHLAAVPAAATLDTGELIAQLLPRIEELWRDHASELLEKLPTIVDHAESAATSVTDDAADGDTDFDTDNNASGTTDPEPQFEADDSDATTVEHLPDFVQEAMLTELELAMLEFGDDDADVSAEDDVIDSAEDDIWDDPDVADSALGLPDAERAVTEELLPPEVSSSTPAELPEEPPTPTSPTPTSPASDPNATSSTPSTSFMDEVNRRLGISDSAKRDDDSSDSPSLHIDTDPYHQAFDPK